MNARACAIAIVAVLGVTAACGSDRGSGTTGGASPDAAAQEDTGTPNPGSDGGAAVDVTSSPDAPFPDSDANASDGGASGDATVVAQCLPDGNGRLTLVTTGALALKVQQGNDADCSGGGGPLDMLNNTGFALGVDAPFAGQPWIGGKHLNVYITIPTALAGATGSYSAHVQIQTYADAVHLSDAKQWSGDCTINITMDQQIARNTTYFTYETAGSVTCSSPLTSQSIDGGAGADPALQVTMLTLVTRYIWG